MKTSSLTILLPLYILLALASSCNKDPLHQTPPTDFIEYRSFLLNVVPEAVSKATCGCCDKPLDQCYNETLNPDAGPHCPVACGTCIIEGRVILALKKQGASDEEAAAQALLVAKGKAPPPPGVSLELDTP